MTDVPRERITIDLRGLGAAIRAHARARHLTVSAAARMAVVAMLESSLSSKPDRAHDEANGTQQQTVKFTVRLPHCVAKRLTSRAQASGLSHGAYLTTLIEGAPAPPLAVDHQESLAAVAVSADQLAVVSADINELIRLVRQGATPPHEDFGDRLMRLAHDVRRHLRVASQLLHELKPVSIRRRSSVGSVSPHRSSQ